MGPSRRLGLALPLMLGSSVLVWPPPANAATDQWAEWDPITGAANDFSTTMRQQAPGFPAAAVASDSRAPVQIASGASVFLGPGTPPGAEYGSSAGSPYIVVRPFADNATSPSTTTYTFENPTPDTGWAFVLGDIDADQVEVRATDQSGDPVTASEVDSWFQGTFNHAGGSDLPVWDAATATLVGNGADAAGPSGWFEPDVRLSSLTLVFTRLAGLPVYQTWFVSRARPIGGTVTDVSTTGSCSLPGSTLTLVSPYGQELATTSPAADGSYSFGDFATQDGYVVRLTPPDGCEAVGSTQADVSNRGADGDPASRADFEVRLPGSPTPTPTQSPSPTEPSPSEPGPTETTSPPVAGSADPTSVPTRIDSGAPTATATAPVWLAALLGAALLAAGSIMLSAAGRRRRH